MTKLVDNSEVLLRQIHPDFFVDGVPARNRFMPYRGDENRMSVDRSSMVSPQDSHLNYTAGGKKSAAVFGITVGEFQAEQISCEEDPVLPSSEGAGNAAHAIADYSLHSQREQEKVATRLRRIAQARGCLFQAP
ncbi:hypothetical protein [Pseudomonas oryzihabitans]|uniref:hypothetical protein n=1 Tax=Pseudomonas oryzihabitans TaxID=47885 RepID=UPI00119E4404|nr:hypothetical protein [Pseudomonas psychrotolerans]